jgi:hypothetical protein
VKGFSWKNSQIENEKTIGIQPDKNRLKQKDIPQRLGWIGALGPFWPEEAGQEV